jgi:LmbE family N-acetylglucosaminyl deacetylase
VLAQHWEQRHPDHATASRLVYDACFVAGLRNYRPELGPAFRPAKVAYATSMTEALEVTPSFVVDVTATFATKMRAIRAFASQFAAAANETVVLPFDSFQKAVELTARRHGQRIGVEYGEGYVLREPLQVDDLLSLRGRSI